MAEFNKTEIKTIRSMIDKVEYLQRELDFLKKELSSFIAEKKELEGNSCNKKKIIDMYSKGIHIKKISEQFNMTRTEIELVIKFYRSKNG